MQGLFCLIDLTYFEIAHSEHGGGRWHVWIQFQALCKGLGGMPVIVLVEVEPSQIVVGSGEVRCEANHLAILLDGCGDVVLLLRRLGLRVELLHLRSDFAILRLCRNRDAEPTER